MIPAPLRASPNRPEALSAGQRRISTQHSAISNQPTPEGHDFFSLRGTRVARQFREGHKFTRADKPLYSCHSEPLGAVQSAARACEESAVHRGNADPSTALPVRKRTGVLARDDMS